MMRLRGSWITLAGALTLAFSAGGLLTADAAEPAGSVFVPVTPTRILDTRLGVGLAGAFSDGQSRKLDVTGQIPVVLDGDQPGAATVVPDGASGIIANVTAVFPTTAGFVSVRPGTSSGEPTTSNINFTTGGVVAPNSVSVELPASGEIGLFFRGTDTNATTHLLVDVVGYLTPGGGGGPGPAGPAGPAGQRGPAGPVASSCVVMLRWDLQCRRPASLEVGDRPRAIAVGAGSVWAANFDGGTVSRIDPMTAEVTETIDVPGKPRGIAYDGTSIWVSGFEADQLSRIDPASNEVTSFPIPAQSAGVAFDGRNLWVAHETNPGTVSKIDPANGSIIGTADVGMYPRAIAFDGRTALWVAHSGANTVAVVDVNTATVTTSVTVGTSPDALVYDGAYMWVANSSSGTVSKVLVVTRTVETTLNTAEAKGLGFDGTYIWVAAPEGGVLHQIDPRVNKLVGSQLTGPGAQGLAFDGTRMWMTQPDDDSVAWFLI